MSGEITTTLIQISMGVKVNVSKNGKLSVKMDNGPSGLLLMLVIDDYHMHLARNKNMQSLVKRKKTMVSGLRSGLIGFDQPQIIKEDIAKVLDIDLAKSKRIESKFMKEIFERFPQLKKSFIEQVYIHLESLGRGGTEIESIIDRELSEKISLQEHKALTDKYAKRYIAEEKQDALDKAREILSKREKSSTKQRVSDDMGKFQDGTFDKNGNAVKSAGAEKPAAGKPIKAKAVRGKGAEVKGEVKGKEVPDRIAKPKSVDPPRYKMSPQQEEGLEKIMRFFRRFVK